MRMCHHVLRMEPGLHPMAEHSLDALCRNTKFTRRQIQLMYRSFKQVGAAADPPAAPTVSVQMVSALVCGSSHDLLGFHQSRATVCPVRVSVVASARRIT